MKWSVDGLLIRENIRLRYMGGEAPDNNAFNQSGDEGQMGRYELHVSGLKVVFLSNGKTRALLSWDGKMPDCMDRFHTRQTTGAMHVDRRFNSHVGIGSREHDFEAGPAT